MVLFARHLIRLDSGSFLSARKLLFGRCIGNRRREERGRGREGACWPGSVFEGRVSEEPWAFWDFMPTATELAGTKPPEGCKTDGLSLVSFLKGGKAPKREKFYWELHEGKRIQALRLGDWKAVRDGPMAPLNCMISRRTRPRQRTLRRTSRTWWPKRRA